jgi:hypothetical protein
MDCERDNSSMNIHHGINSQVLKLGEIVKQSSRNGRKLIVGEIAEH